MSDSLLCAICRWPLTAETPQANCPTCAAAYHADCWQENGGCAVYGCASVPATEKLTATEMPTAFWGQEKKPCPKCGVEILAAAVRCRHCGATFKSAQPESREQFQQRGTAQSNLPKARTAVVWLFVSCLLPLTAPFGAVATLLWRRQRTAELRALPSMFDGMSRIGMYVGFGQCALMIVLMLLYSVSKGLG